MTELLAPTREQAPDVVKPPPGNPRFPLFDSLRGLAALAIVLTHVGLGSGANYNAAYGALLARLDIGVTLFFVLSGFLLYRPFVAARLEDRPALRLRDYARRRVLRIVPAYWLALTVLAIWPGLTFTGPRWVYYGFLQNYDFLWVLGGLGQAWSLAVEASFYVLLPFYALALGALTRRFAPRRTLAVEVTVLGALSVGSLVLRWYIHHTSHSQVLLFTILCTFFWFALGMGLAVASAAWHDRESRPGVIGLVERAPSLWWAAALGLFAVMSWGYGLPRGLSGTTSGVQYLGEHLTYGAVVVPARAPGGVGRSARRAAAALSPPARDGLAGPRLLRPVPVARTLDAVLHREGRGRLASADRLGVRRHARLRPRLLAGHGRRQLLPRGAPDPALQGRLQATPAGVRSRADTGSGGASARGPRGLTPRRVRQSDSPSRTTAATATQWAPISATG